MAGSRCHPDVVHRARSFGSVAEQYERGRPSYPRSALRWLLGEMPRDVVDLGAGTGKLTSALVAAGHRVVAVEPVAEMRTILLERVPEATVVPATAEDTGLPETSADAVVAGAAFHWFDRQRTFPEIARILRPHGTLGLLGNGFDASVPWVRRFGEILGGPRQPRGASAAARSDRGALERGARAAWPGVGHVALPDAGAARAPPRLTPHPGPATVTFVLSIESGLLLGEWL